MGAVQIDYEGRGPISTRLQFNRFRQPEMEEVANRLRFYVAQWQAQRWRRLWEESWGEHQQRTIALQRMQDEPSMAVCRAYRAAIMHTTSYYYFHLSCWDTLHNVPKAATLSNGEWTSLKDGYARLVQIEAMKGLISCKACHTWIKNN
jgi:hypothetical protein